MPKTTTAAEAAPANELADVWHSLSRRLHKETSPQTYSTWFRLCTPLSLSDGAFTLACPNSFTKQWIDENYTDLLKRLLARGPGDVSSVTLVADPEACAQAKEPDSDEVSDPQGEAPAIARLASPRRPPGTLLSSSDFILNPTHTFDSFVIGPCNRFGAALATGAADQPGSTYNPLFLHGSVGIGKTHLLQGLCHRILEKDPEKRILYVSCETFVNHFVSALEHRTLAAFRDKYRHVDVLVVDDIHLLANKERTQDEFFHTFNQLYNEQKQIVLSSDAPPKEIPTLQDRLVSRFKWGIVAELQAPCYETRMAIVSRKSQERGRPFPGEVLQLIAEHIVDNVRELEGAVARLIAFSEMTKRPIGAALAREALGDLLQASPGGPSVDGIVAAITKRYDLKLSDLQGKRRTASIVWPRQIAMFLCRVLLPWSLEEIGAYFGGRDHSTVLHGVDKVKTRAAGDPGVRKELAALLTQLGGGPLEKHLG